MFAMLNENRSSSAMLICRRGDWQRDRLPVPVVQENAAAMRVVETRDAGLRRTLPAPVGYDRDRLPCTTSKEMSVSVSARLVERHAFEADIRAPSAPGRRPAYPGCRTLLEVDAIYEVDELILQRAVVADRFERHTEPI
jgi:hypothetical protein